MKLLKLLNTFYLTYDIGKQIEAFFQEKVEMEERTKDDDNNTSLDQGWLRPIHLTSHPYSVYRSQFTVTFSNHPITH